jgi:glucitol operon activator protein
MSEYFWFFIGIALLLAVQLYYAAVQSKAFMAAVTQLRGKGAVAIGLGKPKRWFGRKAYVALAQGKDGSVVDAIVLRGITTFARPKPLTELIGVPIELLAGDDDLPGCSRLLRSAARQAAQTLNTSGGWQPTGGVEGKESAQPATSPLQ